jgi:hypothetical protein
MTYDGTQPEMNLAGDWDGPYVRPVYFRPGKIVEFDPIKFHPGMIMRQEISRDDLIEMYPNA